MNVGRLLLITLLAGLVGCGNHPPDSHPSPPTSAVPAASPPIVLKSVAREAGIHFTLGHGGKSPLDILETSGGGCAFIDYDNDGWPDILLVGPHNAALYHNRGDGRFDDVTKASGIDTKRFWMGCAVGDYDGDGRMDIFLTGYKCFALYHNEGNGKFRDVTSQSGISGLDWSLSAAFADFNGDGKIDLYVSQYLKLDDTTTKLCNVAGFQSACGPETYESESGKLFINVNGSSFRPVPWKDTGKTWGALASDLFGEGRPSLYLANDMALGDLWVTDKKATAWSNVGQLSGVATDAQGNIQGGMGVDSGDYDNDGLLDLLVTTYFAQQKPLYHNDGKRQFSVVSGMTGFGPATMPYVSFGTNFVDMDNDGWLDIVIASGHVRDNVHAIDSSQTYAQPVKLFKNDNGHFRDESKSSGLEAMPMLVGRGLSVGDFNGDGRPDVLICNLEGEAVLLENQSPLKNWLDVRLSQPGTNRFAIGAMVRIKSGSLNLMREIKTCGSVMSGREPAAHFGLASEAGPIELTITWPDSKVQKVKVDKLNRRITIAR